MRRTFGHRLELVGHFSFGRRERLEDVERVPVLVGGNEGDAGALVAGAASSTGAVDVVCTIRRLVSMGVRG